VSAASTTTVTGRSTGVNGIARPRHPVVLLYHRVADLTFDPQRLAVSPTNFAEQLVVIRAVGHPMSLTEFTRRLECDDPPDDAVVVTLDDGYADNLEIAEPLLRAVDVPATVFAVSDRVGSEREFWWDDLERIVFHTPRRAGVVAIEIEGEMLRWELGPDDAEGASSADWSVLDANDPTPRHGMYRTLFARLKPWTEPVRTRILERLRGQLGADDAPRASHRVLSDTQMRDLAAGGLVEIGAHTRTHPVLSVMSYDAQRAEIVESKRRIEDIVGRAVESFSYPFGTRSDYAAESLSIVREAGFRCACVNHAGPIGWNNRFRLPRFIVRNWNGDAFARRLREACRVD